MQKLYFDKDMAAMLTITYHGIKKNISAYENQSILSLVRDNFECSFSSCAKSGKCGKCICYVKKVNLHEAGTLEVDSKLQDMSDENKFANFGYEKRQACQVIALDNMDVICAFIEDYDEHTSIITLQGEETFLNEKEEATLNDYIAVDLGSTTIAMSDGVKSHAFLNPQRCYGADVISRMEISNQGGAKKIKELTLNKLNEGLNVLDPEGKKKHVLIAGNTAMVHLLMGHSCEGISAYPFEGAHTESEVFEAFGRKFVTVPGISAFVGGDIVSGLYYIEHMRQNAPAKGTDIAAANYLFIDLGTNGELALRTSEGFLCTSAAAGPAFEGNVTANVPGSDLVHIVAKARQNGLIDETGLLCDEYFDEGFKTKEGVLLTQQSIRDLQLAKAAAAYAVDALLKRANLNYAELDAVYIAGGFGYYLKPEDAAIIKLLPDELAEKIIAVGNTSLKGALLAAKNDDINGLLDIVKKSKALLLSQADDFGAEYIRQLNF